MSALPQEVFVTETPETKQLIKGLLRVQEWHEENCSKLRAVLDHPEATLELRANHGKLVKVEAGTDTAHGIRTGIEIALSFLGDLPFSIEPAIQCDCEECTKAIARQ